MHEKVGRPNFHRASQRLSGQQCHEEGEGGREWMTACGINNGTGT